MEFKLPKTQDFMKMIKNLKADDRKTLLILSDVDKEVNTFLSARNVTNVMPLFHTDVLLDDILNADRVLMTETTAKLIEGGLK
jgi:large subunit ribosomal protein L4